LDYLGYLTNFQYMSINAPPVLTLNIIIISILGIGYHIYLYMEMVQRRNTKIRDENLLLAHTAHLTSLGELSENIAHEINTPLCAIEISTHAGIEILQE